MGGAAIASFILQLSQTANLASPGLGWSDSTVWTQSPLDISPAYQSLIHPTLGFSGARLWITTDGTDPTGNEAAYFLLAAGPPPPASVRITLRGVKRRRCEAGKGVV
jgi:hypothetical protein